MRSMAQLEEPLRCGSSQPARASAPRLRKQSRARGRPDGARPAARRRLPDAAARRRAPAAPSCALAARPRRPPWAPCAPGPGAPRPRPAAPCARTWSRVTMRVAWARPGLVPDAGACLHGTPGRMPHRGQSAQASCRKPGALQQACLPKWRTAACPRSPSGPAAAHRPDTAATPAPAADQGAGAAPPFSSPRPAPLALVPASLPPSSLLKAASAAPLACRRATAAALRSS
jgi:translation initiation factor IF-2